MADVPPEVIEQVRANHERAGKTDIIDRGKKARELREETAADYEKYARSRVSLDQPMIGVSKASWHKIRAAVLARLSLDYSQMRRNSDMMQGAGRYSQALYFAQQASQILDRYIAASTADKPQESAKKRQTKRRTLPKSENWQVQLFHAATPAMRPALAVLWSTGARPAEVEQGVKVSRLKNGDVKITIPGAKVTENSGQKIRELTIAANTNQAKALEHALKGSNEVIVQRKAKRLNNDFAKIRSKTGFKVSPYSLRHQFAADLKKAQLNQGVIAQAMGHATDRSQNRYGAVSQGKGGLALVDVQASRPSKPNMSSYQGQRFSPASP